MNPTEIRKAIESEDDFGHEMRVNNELNKAAAFCPASAYEYPVVTMIKHGETYVDPITGKDRQFDFRCHAHLNYGPNSTNQFGVFLAIECKNLHRSSPLVICGRERTSEEAYHTFVEVNWQNGIAFPRATKITRSGYYPKNDFVGKSLLRLRQDKGKVVTEPQQDIYDRWSQAVTSGKELAKEAWMSSAPKKDGRRCTIALPVVVLPNGILWKVTYGNTGAILGEPEPIDECTFFIASQLETERGQQPLVLTHIHFVTIKGFELLLQKFLKDPEMMRDLILRG